LNEGDGVAISTSGSLRIEGAADAEVLLFDLGP
jgi:Quercetinase C-terminal cupin domain